MSIVAALLLILQVTPPVPAAGLPAASGVYLRQDDKWIAFKPAQISGSKTKGLGSFVDTGGYTNLGTNASIPGAKSSTRIFIPQPTFYVREVGHSKDVMLIRLAKSGNSRTFHTSTGDATVENKEGFRKADIRKTIVTEYPDGTYSVKPEDELKPGEYLVVFGDVGSSYDFGIDEQK